MLFLCGKLLLIFHSNFSKKKYIEVIFKKINLMKRHQITSVRNSQLENNHKKLGVISNLDLHAKYGFRNAKVNSRSSYPETSQV